jgi:hypothetical protein
MTVTMAVVAAAAAAPHGKVPATVTMVMAMPVLMAVVVETVPLFGGKAVEKPSGKHCG